MKTNFKSKGLIFSLVLSALVAIVFDISVSAQNTCKINDTVRTQNRYVLGLLPSRAKNLYGIAIGPIGSECFCYLPYTRKSYGLNIQIGQGIFQTFMINRWHLDNYANFADSLIKPDILQKNELPLKKVVHNGILLSVFGTFSDQINGISSSLWMSSNRSVNGLSVNLLWNIQQKINGAVIGLVNTTIKTNGIQIGLYNKSIRLKGLQLGIWNVNEKRSLPLINWSFK